MSGQRLDVGEHGDIQYRTKASGRVAATAYFRDPQGVRKRLEATGDSKTAARRLLIKKLEEAVSAGAAGYTRQSTFAQVAADWLHSLDELVAAGRRSPRTVALYRHVLARHVLPGLGALRLSELTAAREWTGSSEIVGSWRATRSRNFAGRLHQVYADSQSAGAP